MNFFTFIANLAVYVENFINLSAKLTLLGDFTIHKNDLNNPKASIFLGFPRQCQFINLYFFAHMYLTMHWTWSLQMSIPTLAADFMQNEMISDHFAVSFNTSILSLSLDTKAVTYRNCNQINHNF